jgi:hypothetical protein
MHMGKEQSSGAVYGIPHNKGGRKRCWSVGCFLKWGKQRSACRWRARHVSLFWHSLAQRVPCSFTLMRVCSIRCSHKVRLRVVIYCREMKYWTAFAIQGRTYETYGYTIYLPRPVKWFVRAGVKWNIDMHSLFKRDVRIYHIPSQRNAPVKRLEWGSLRLAPIILD